MIPRIVFLLTFFASESSGEADIDIGAEIIGMVKTNTEGVLKDTT